MKVIIIYSDRIDNKFSIDMEEIMTMEYGIDTDGCAGTGHAIE